MTSRRSCQAAGGGVRSTNCASSRCRSRRSSSSSTARHRGLRHEGLHELCWHEDAAGAVRGSGLSPSFLLSVLFALGGYLFKTFGDMSSQMMARVSPEILAGLFGGALGGLSPLETWLVTLFVHPVMLVVLASIVIASSSRAMAAEIDDGTVDLLLSYPVPRWVVVAVAFVAIQLQLIVLCVTVHGFAARRPDRTERSALPERWSGFLWVTFNLWALYFAASGVALWTCRRRASERGDGDRPLSGVPGRLLFRQPAWALSGPGSRPCGSSPSSTTTSRSRRSRRAVRCGGISPSCLVVGTLGTGAAFWRFVSRDIHVA